MARGVIIREYPSGKRVLQIQFQFRGVACREHLAWLDPDKVASQRYAVNLKAEIEAKIGRDTFVYTDYFPNSKRARIFGHVVSSMTVKQAQAGLLADLERAGIEQTTLGAYKRSAARIDGLIGRHRVVDLTPEDIRDMVRGRPVSRKTWNNDLIPLRRALRRAVNDGILLASPLERVELNELVPKLKRPTPDPFSLGEIDTVLATASGYCRRMWNLAETLFFTGLRLEEVAALQWDDVDLAAGRLYVTRAAMLSLKTARTKAPKTAAGERTIDLLARASAALKRQRTITGFRGGYVFTRWNSFAPFSSHDQLRGRWQTVQKLAGVRPRPLSQARHTYASHMLSSGEREIYVAAQLGHRGTSLLDVYATWVDEWREEGRKYGT